MESISTPALARAAQEYGLVDAVLVDDEVYHLQIGNRRLVLAESETHRLLLKLITLRNDADEPYLVG